MDIERLFLRRLNIDPKLVYFHSNDSKKKYKIVTIILLSSFEKSLKKKKKKSLSTIHVLINSTLNRTQDFQSKKIYGIWDSWEINCRLLKQIRIRWCPEMLLESSDWIRNQFRKTLMMPSVVYSRVVCLLIRVLSV